MYLNYNQQQKKNTMISGKNKKKICICLKLCSKKNCLEQEICILSLKISIPGPEVLDSIYLSKAKCTKNNKNCSNDRVCEILGQCILDHPLVKHNKMATKDLRKKCDINHVIRIISRLMPSLKTPGKKFI